jgi:hypothetical protein
VHTESLIVDVSNLIASIGGNLGLFLGISCLSLFLVLVDILGSKLK